MKRLNKINSKRLIALRTKAMLSQKELAAKVNVNPGTVSRWERGDIDRIRQDIFGKLQSVLSATPADLCGEGPFPEYGTPQLEPQKGQMNLSIDAACRNALALVAHRYGVKRKQIVEVAPLLFFIVAEQSLRQRGKRLRELREAADAVGEATPSHLPLYHPVDDLALEYEKRSIDARDLFATIVSTNVELHDGWDEEELNPFAAFLSGALAEIGASEERVQWARYDSPTYQICAEEAAALVGSDEQATDAIACGRAALHEMPVDVRKASPAARAEWARAEANKWIVATPDFDAIFGESPMQPETGSNDSVDSIGGEGS